MVKLGKGTRRRIRLWVLCILAVCLLAPIARDLTHLREVGDLAHSNPQSTALMRQRAAQARSRGKAPRRYQVVVAEGAISPFLKGAVIGGEDRHFFLHNGVDLGDVKDAVETNVAAGRLVTGGSSITQQLAKNLYLNPSRSFTRKASELVIALALERRLPKSRILTLYLNNIEWGDGVYGCEAAARTYFRKSAKALTPEEAIRLASIIPNPRRLRPLTEGSRLASRRHAMAANMYRQGYLSAAQYRSLPFGGPDLPEPDDGGPFRRLLPNQGLE